jgi:F0F1-type ATP synthase membrane subunit b/b'
MSRITAYALPVFYALLFGAIWLLHHSKGLPESIAGLRGAVDYSLLVMLAIFWAVYFLAKRNLFDPLASVMDRRGRFVRERAEARDRAERALREAREAFDRRLKEVRQEEQAAVEALRQELSARRDQALARERQAMQAEMESARARLEAEGERARDELGPAARSIAGAIIARVTNRHAM